MADEHRPHPPTERRLARLWSAGATSASPALVGAAVLAAAWLLALSIGPAAFGWCADLARQGLSHAAKPDAVESAVAQTVLRGALIIGVVSAILLAVALLAQLAQRGPVPSGSPSALPAERTSPAAAGFDGLRALRGILMVALAAAGVAAVVRVTLGAAPGLLEAGELPRAAGALAVSIGWPLLLVVVGAAALDALLGRAAWCRRAWMGHRELQEELRESEGHPLSRERRDRMRRGR